MPDPTPAAAATSAVLRRPADNDHVEPLSPDDEALCRRAVFPDAPFVDAAEWSEWSRVVRALFVMLDAAVAQRDAAAVLRDQWYEKAQDFENRLEHAQADLAEFARQTREAQASLLAAIKDKETERKRADAEERLQMDTKALLAEHTVIISRRNDEIRDLEAALADERARGERLAAALVGMFHSTHDGYCDYDARYETCENVVCRYQRDIVAALIPAAPSSPAAEPADQLAAADGSHE